MGHYYLRISSDLGINPNICMACGAFTWATQNKHFTWTYWPNYIDYPQIQLTDAHTTNENSWFWTQNVNQSTLSIILTAASPQKSNLNKMIQLQWLNIFLEYL